MDRRGLPPTFGRPLASNESVEELIFDPSTQHYSRAFRRGDPKLPAHDMIRWHAARREAMRHLLLIATTSKWANHLVLRGSLALKACLGEAAREPGDIDWIVQPASLSMDSPEAKRMLNDIIAAVAANATCGSARIEHEDITRTDIWTYDRAPGHRIAFPWRCGELPPAIVQMDFVFQQQLHTPVIWTEVRLDESDGVVANMASLEESLAWKLLWLSTDIHPQGKDLYDAVLLAERSSLTAPLLETVLDEGDAWRQGLCLEGVPFEMGDDAFVNWENFLKECPWVQGTVYEWKQRLNKSIGPVVTELRNKVTRSASSM